jgi:CBS domain containing-hemolysin-like protein
MALLIFYFLLALGVSFLCSIMEAVLLSVTPSYLALQEQRGGATAKRLRELKTDIDRPLAAILSLNTIAHTIGAMGAGAQAAIVFGQAYLGIISGILTLLILVLSEIIPKTLGALYWKALVPTVVRLLWPLMWLMWPLVKLSQGITGFLSRGRKNSSVSRAEMAAMADLGTKEGVIEEGESRILKHLFRFSSLHAEQIMTPREDVFTLGFKEELTAEVIVKLKESGYTRFPVMRDDRIVSVLNIKGLVGICAGAGSVDELSADNKIVHVRADAKADDMLHRMIKGKVHMAAVSDQSGWVGIVTMEDVLEALVGHEITDVYGH